MTDNYAAERAKEIYNGYKHCKELRRQLIISAVLSFALTIAWYAIWIFSIKAYFEKPWATFNPQNIIMYIAIAVIIAIPFFLFKPQRWFKKGYFAGRLTNVDVEVIRYTLYTSYIYLKLHIKLFNSTKTVKRNIKNFTASYAYLPPNSPIIFLNGFSYPVKITARGEIKSDDEVLCPKCGSYTSARNERCTCCRTYLWFANI